MEINRLARDELVYEIERRGLSVGDVDPMRKSLRAARAMERRGSVVESDTYPFTFEQDRDAIERKIVEIRALVAGRPEHGSSDYKKILTKIDWATSRIGRSRAITEDETEIKKELKTELVNILGELEDNDEDESDYDDNATINDKQVVQQPQQQQQQQLQQQQRPVEPRRVEPSTSASGLGTNPNTFADQRVYVHSEKPENLSKWNILFTGERCGASVNSFLERVEELRGLVNPNCLGRRCTYLLGRHFFGLGRLGGRLLRGQSW